MMLIIVIMLQLFLPVVSNAQSDFVSLFNEANALYENHEYEKAVDLYEAILNTGLENSDIEYNLGNAYFRLGKFGIARLHYERAEKLSPKEPDVLNNIRLIESRFLKNTLQEENFSTIDRFLWDIVTIVPKQFLIWIIIISYVLLNLIYTLNIFKPAMLHSAIKWSVAIVLILLCTLSFSLVITSEVLESSDSYAIVVVNDADVASEPSESAVGRFPAPESMKVIILKDREDWYEIMLPNGSKGWIQKDSIAII